MAVTWKKLIYYDELEAHKDLTTGVHGAGAGTLVATPLTANLDFAKYQAIALVCHKGATMPADPTDGQWFLHTPTGRNVLYQYNSEWISIISVGSMTVYVDKTDGTDDLNHGTAVNADAFATVQYAVDCIPGIVGGNVTININDEDCDETVTIQGKSFTGSYSITLQGTLVQLDTGTIESAVQGTGATRGSITDTGKFTGYANKLLYANSEYRLIDSVTADIATIVGCWSAEPSGTWVIYDWDTSINKVVVQNGQQSVNLYDINLDTSIGLLVTRGASVNGYRLKITDANVGYGGLGYLYQSYLTSPGAIVINTHTFGFLYFSGSKVYTTSTNDYCIRLYNVGQLYLYGGSILDASSTTGTYGISCYGNSTVITSTSATPGYPIIRNQAVGIYSYQGGQVITNSIIQYSGNTADESAVAASYGYID